MRMKVGDRMKKSLPFFHFFVCPGAGFRKVLWFDQIGISMKVPERQTIEPVFRHHV